MKGGDELVSPLRGSTVLISPPLIWRVVRELCPHTPRDKFRVTPTQRRNPVGYEGNTRTPFRHVWANPNCHTWRKGVLVLPWHVDGFCVHWLIDWSCLCFEGHRTRCSLEHGLSDFSWGDWFVCVWGTSHPLLPWARLVWFQQCGDWRHLDEFYTRQLTHPKVRSVVMIVEFLSNSQSMTSIPSRKVDLIRTIVHPNATNFEIHPRTHWGPVSGWYWRGWDSGCRGWNLWRPQFQRRTTLLWYITVSGWLTPRTHWEREEDFSHWKWTVDDFSAATTRSDWDLSAE